MISIDDLTSRIKFLIKKIEHLFDLISPVRNENHYSFFNLKKRKEKKNKYATTLTNVKKNISCEKCAP